MVGMSMTVGGVGNWAFMAGFSSGSGSWIRLDQGDMDKLLAPLRSAEKSWEMSKLETSCESSSSSPRNVAEELVCCARLAAAVTGDKLGLGKLASCADSVSRGVGR